MSHSQDSGGVQSVDRAICVLDLLARRGPSRVTEVAAACLFTYPGIPAIFAGDEGGAVGRTGEQGRTTMPWDQIAGGGGPRWDAGLCGVYRDLIALRKQSDALCDGGLRWVVVDEDALGYLRELPGERLLVILARAPWQGVTLPAWLAPQRTAELRYGGRLAGTPQLKVADDALVGGGEGPAVGVWQLG